MDVAQSDMQTAEDVQEKMSSECGESVGSDDRPEQNVNTNPARQFQFVMMNEKKIYRIRKYVKRKNQKLLEVDHDSNEAEGSRSRRLAIYNGHAEARRTFRPEIRDLQHHIFWNIPVQISPTGKRALWFLAQEGVRCPVLRKWFIRGIYDDCVVHCLMLESVSFTGMMSYEKDILDVKPSLLPYKIRAIQATNQLLRDETRNTSDLALVAVAILSSFERRNGDESGVILHAKGFQSILDGRKAKYGHIDDCCPMIMKGVYATASIANFVRSFRETNSAPIDDSISSEAHTDQLLQRLRTSLFCVIRLAAGIICDSRTPFNDVLKKIENMLEKIQTQPLSATRRYEFTECTDLLDDLWVSQARFTHAISSDPMTEGVARSGWVGAVGCLLWISKVTLDRAPDESSAMKKVMLEWICHPSVREMTEFPLSLVREWAELACKGVHTGFRDLDRPR